MTIGQGFHVPGFREEFEQFIDDISPSDDTIVTEQDIAVQLRKIRLWLDSRGVPPEQLRGWIALFLGPLTVPQEGSPAASREAVFRLWAEAFGVEVTEFKQWVH